MHSWCGLVFTRAEGVGAHERLEQLRHELAGVDERLCDAVERGLVEVTVRARRSTERYVRNMAMWLAGRC